MDVVTVDPHSDLVVNPRCPRLECPAHTVRSAKDVASAAPSRRHPNLKCTNDFSSQDVFGLDETGVLVKCRLL